jgi:hypothetical protein
VDLTTDPATRGASQIQMPCGRAHVSVNHLEKEMRKRADQDEQNSVHDLSVQCKKEWPVLHSIEIEAVKPIRERECSYERTFVCEESTFYEIGRLAVF